MFGKEASLLNIQKRISPNNQAEPIWIDKVEVGQKKDADKYFLT